MKEKLELKSVDQARKVIPARHLQLSRESAKVGAPGVCHGSNEPRVETIKDGEFVRAIEVTCGCGQRIRLRCVQD